MRLAAQCDQDGRESGQADRDLGERQQGGGDVDGEIPGNRFVGGIAGRRR